MFSVGDCFDVFFSAALLCCRCMHNVRKLFVSVFFFFFSSRRRHTRCLSDWSSDVCSSDLGIGMSLYAKRLERGRFIWPSPADGVVAISAAQLAYMLDGIDWRNLVRTWRPRSEERRVGKECRCRWAEDWVKKR